MPQSAEAVHPGGGVVWERSSRDTPRMNFPKRIGRWLRWVIAVLAMAFVVRQLVSDPGPLRRVLEIGPGVLAALCALMAVNQALMSLRFELALNHTGGRRLGFVAWFHLTSVGQMLNLFVPQLGNVYRAVKLKRDHGVSYLGYATALVSFVWLDIVMGMVIAILTVASVEPGLRFGGVSALALLGLGLLGVFFGPIGVAAVMQRLPPRSGFFGRMQARFTSLLATSSRVARSPALMARYFLLNVVVTASQVATLWLMFHAVGAKNMGISGLVLFQILLKLSNQLVVTPGNLGITELAFGALAHGSEATLEQGLAASLLLRAVGSVMVVILGMISGGADALFGGRRALLEEADRLADQPQTFSATKK
jgi:uncharacterized membrane protein YbhN (UPF0104 family)